MNSPTKEQDIKALVLEIARASANKGPGWSQEGVVFREIGDRIAGNSGSLDLSVERMVLDAWHDLFTEKVLGWGYDMDNPNSPFFHVR